MEFAFFRHVTLFNSLVWLISAYAIIKTGGYQYTRAVKFRAHEINSDERACSTGTPSLNFHGVRSKIMCTALCLQDASCLGVNWKMPDTCEIYRYPPRTFEPAKSCDYYKTGKHFCYPIIITESRYSQLTRVYYSLLLVGVKNRNTIV